MKAQRNRLNSYLGVLILLMLCTATRPSVAAGNVVGHWKFHEASGSVVTDSSGSGSNSTLVGGPLGTSGGACNASGGNTTAHSERVLADTLDQDPIVFPGTQWTYKTPEELGLNPAKLDEFRDATGGSSGKKYAGVVVKDGHIAYSWGNVSQKYDWASADKGVHSTMLLFAVQEGKLASPDALIADWGWHLLPKDQPMTFRHLANMTSGYALPESPGTHRAYNDYSVALYKKTLYDRVYAEGAPDAAARQPTRLGALQFEDGSILGSGAMLSRLGPFRDVAEAARNAFGSGTTRYRLRTSVRDLARVGWFWLNRGNWNGVQVLQDSCFDMFVPQVPADLPRTVGGVNDYLDVGSDGAGSDESLDLPGAYGFSLWHNPEKARWPDLPADTYAAIGRLNAKGARRIPQPAHGRRLERIQRYLRHLQIGFEHQAQTPR